MLRGRAKFQKRDAVDGELEIAPRSTDEACLRQWIVEDLRRRVEALEDELGRLRAARG